MSTPKHTPGPWKPYFGSDNMTGNHPAEIGAPTGHPIANVFRPDPAIDGDYFANALLIAAAPDLLAACRRMVEALSVHHMAGAEPFPGDERYAEAHQGLYEAIAKAAGEAQS